MWNLGREAARPNQERQLGATRGPLQLSATTISLIKTPFALLESYHVVILNSASALAWTAFRNPILRPTEACRTLPLTFLKPPSRTLSLKIDAL